MFKQKILVGKLFDFSIISCILELRKIAKLHKIGDSFIELPHWGIRYEASYFRHLLDGLESVAKDNQLVIQSVTADSSLDELLGIGETKEIEVSLTLASWAILADVDRRMSNDGSGGVQAVREMRV